MSRNIELIEVSEATGISSGVLKVLESDNRDEFPAEVYTKGFYKKYAEFLGLNPENILTAYKEQTDKKSKARGRANFNIEITLKGKEETLLDQISRRALLPVIIIIISCALLYWIYNRYLFPFSPLDYFR